MDVLKKFFEQHFRTPAGRVQPLHGQLGGSGRKLVRISNKEVSAIGVLYNGREENVAFLEFSRHFRRHGLPVPEIYAVDLDQGAYVEEDLGDTTLFESLSLHRTGSNRSLSKSGLSPAAFSGRSRAGSELQGVLPTSQLRSPVHQLGSELL